MFYGFTKLNISLNKIHICESSIVIDKNTKCKNVCLYIYMLPYLQDFEGLYKNK